MSIKQNLTPSYFYYNYYRYDPSGALMMGDVHIPSLVNAMDVANFGSQPFYVTSEPVIEFQMQQAKSALKDCGALVTYAIKANSQERVLGAIHRGSIGAEVASVEELVHALDTRFPPKKIVADGIGKGNDYFNLALKENIFAINCNDGSELARLKAIMKMRGFEKNKPHIGLRITPDVKTGETKKTSTANNESKFGVTLKQAAKLMREYAELNLGVHVHLGSNIADRKQFTKGYKKVAKFVEAMNGEGQCIDYIDCGGGVGVPYNLYGALNLPARGNDEIIVDIKSFGDELGKLKRQFSDATIVAELGRFMVAPATVYFCQVMGISEKGEHTHIITNGKMTDVPRAAMYGAGQLAFPVVNESSVGSYGANTAVVGRMCESGDKLALDCAGMPKVRPGDWVGITVVGAYSQEMAEPFYNSMGTAPGVWLEKDKVSIATLPLSARAIRKMQQGYSVAQRKVPELQLTPVETAEFVRRQRARMIV